MADALPGTGYRYHRRASQVPPQRRLTELDGLSPAAARRAASMPVAVTPSGNQAYHRIGSEGMTGCNRRVFHTGLLGEIARYRTPCGRCFPPGSALE